MSVDRTINRAVPRSFKGPRAASLLLRVGLAFTFSYAAISAFRTPDAWLYFVPSFVDKIVEPRLALDMLSVGQLVLAAWLLTGMYVRYAALLAIGFLGGLLVFNPDAFLITFRDVALIAAALALIALDLNSLDTTRK